MGAARLRGWLQWGPTEDPMPSAQSTPPEVSLVARIRDGDAAAESELVRAFELRIYTMAVMKTRDPEAARDLAQDALLAVLGALRAGELREPTKLAAFVWGTARNVINDHLRRSSRNTASPLPPELPGRDPSPHQVLEAEERTRLVQRALAALEAKDREILLLTLVDGRTPAEIAALLDLSPQVVRARKSRALKKLIASVRQLSRVSRSTPPEESGA